MKGAAGAPQQSITEVGDHVSGQEGDAHSGAGGGGRQADTLPAWVNATIGERSQVWRYQGGSDYYRLGYVFIQRYYEPTLFKPFVEIRVYSSAGQPPDSGWMCDDVLLRCEAA